ncbi:hypothetical protein NpNSSI1_00004135 [Neofusicoccum parvum]|nr:hypothetical protein NpNSSI1_00004135 [Neofusicoccum parvum]
MASSSYDIHHNSTLEALLNPQPTIGGRLLHLLEGDDLATQLLCDLCCLRPDLFLLAAPTVGSLTAEGFLSTVEEFLSTVPELDIDADGLDLHHTLQLMPEPARLELPEGEANRPAWEQGVTTGDLEEGLQDAHDFEHAMAATNDTEDALLECLARTDDRDLEPLPSIEEFDDVELFFDIERYERSTTGASPDVSEETVVLSESGSSPSTADDSSCSTSFTCTDNGGDEGPENG